MKEQNQHPFKTQEITFSTGAPETVVIGGPDQFHLINEALPEKVRQIAVIGWGSQGPSHAKNIRETLEAANCNIRVVVGLREDSKSIPSAEAAGFTRKDGTLGELYQVISESDLVIIHMSDGAQVENHEAIFAAMKPGATLGFSHGFLEGYLTANEISFPEDINVVMVAPKGMGPSVRNLYLNGSGINSSYAVHQDVDGHAESIAIAWSIAIGSPVTFKTTMPKEWRSDIFGERAILLGGVWALVEVAYRRLMKQDSSEEDAFTNSVEAVTSFISPEISKLGLRGFFKRHFENDSLESEFNLAFNLFYGPFRGVMEEIYENTSSGAELTEVIEKTAALDTNPMGNIEAERMWQVGKTVREKRTDADLEINAHVAFVSGALVAGIMAQLDFLIEKGHCVSEVINESLIELTDSLIPFMDSRGVANMVDGCSTTARLGTRKWGPRFMEALAEALLTEEDSRKSIRKNPHNWISSSLHADIIVCGRLKPKQAIAVDAAA